MAGPRGPYKAMGLGGAEAGRAESVAAEAGARITITPPPLTQRVVGRPLHVQIEVQAEADVERAEVRVEPQGSLRLTDEEPVVYRGPLQAAQPKRLWVGIIATEAGTQKGRVSLSSELPGVAAAAPLTMPDFQLPPQHLTTRVFTAVPLDRALRAVAHQARVRIMFGEGVGHARVSADFSQGIPAEAALRILAESGGCRLEVIGSDVYRVSRPTDEEAR